MRRQERQIADDAWRKALHHECWLNINLDKELPADGLWSFDTRVLRESTAHATAFNGEVLQRIIWARTANEQLEAALGRLRNDVAPTTADQDSWKQAVEERRHRVIGEISAIELELRT